MTSLGAPASLTDGSQRAAGAVGVTLDSLYGMLLDIRADIRAVKQNYSELQASVNFCSEKISDFELTVKVLTDKCKAIDGVAAENASLRRDFDALRDRVDELEQYSRRSNVEIQGVPEVAGENVSSLVDKIAAFLEVGVVTSDVDVVHRVPRFGKNQDPKPIIVKFCRRSKRDGFLAAAIAKKKSLPAGSPSGFQIPGVSDRCFINDHLTAANKNLFAKTRNRARAAGYKYIWTRDCKIFVRKDDTSRAVRILSESHLNGL